MRPSGNGSARYRIRKTRSYHEVAGQFASNDYLSLSRHPHVIEAGQQALTQWGAGSSGSPLLSGYTLQHQALEEELADWLGMPACLLFSSGYAANHGCLTTLIEAGQNVFCDRLCHASLLDGLKHSRRRFRRFAHNQIPGTGIDPDDWLITEGTFSMDGDYVDHVAVQKSVDQHGTKLFLDDAHGLGVWGEQGLASFGRLRRQTRLLTGTFGKAFGVGGAFVAADIADIEQLIQYCREYIYSTAFSPAQAACIRASLQLIRSDEGDQRRRQLKENIAYFRQLARHHGLQGIESSSPIQVWILGDDAQAVNYARQLAEANIHVSAVRPPTVPEGTARLRFSLQADHTSADIEALFAAIERLLPDSGNRRAV
ncbi:8-amino-7-oxononanoate synthase [Idiomarina seosinensis]|uniref:aminotransferase class I/II-fold pyridoxal phosphate-dependent enzyme n=1 Tax=Idiomarina seosinensis TaxID=281739 RepID=UPI00384D8E42